MLVLMSDIPSIGKKFWRLVEVYIFVMMSTVAGSAITKDVASTKSKVKDKTLREDIELFQVCAATPLQAARALKPATATRAAVRTVFKTRCAIEKGAVVQKFTGATQFLENRLSAFMHQYQERVHHRLPLPLSSKNRPLLI